jgi:hypothetical protein
VSKHPLGNAAHHDETSHSDNNLVMVGSTPHGDIRSRLLVLVLGLSCTYCGDGDAALQPSEASDLLSQSSAGSGGSAVSATPATTTATSSSCPTTYTVATHVVIDVNWDGSLALAKGSGQVHVWSKSKLVENGTKATVTTKPCGISLPVTTTSDLAGGYSVLPEIADTAWDSPSMPTFTGTATRLATGAWQVDPGVALVGLSMATPNAKWPDVDEITGVDVDGDGTPGVTAIPRVGGNFQQPALNLSQSQHADELHLISRNIMTLTYGGSGCPTRQQGVADVTAFDSHIIGCHVSGGAACTENQRDFVDSNRTVYEAQGGSFTSQRVADTASCDEVRSALPIQ